MKVKCIKNKNCDYLTIGKYYDVLENSEYDYYLINNIGRHDFYFKEYFKTQSEIRNEKIDKLLE